MSTHFYPLRVREIRRETPDTVSLAFEVPADLQPAFDFRQGQYLTFRRFAGHEEIRRSYSICSGRHEGELRVAVKRLPGGVFSSFVHESLCAGDVLDTMPPQGSFFVELQPPRHATYVAFAAGSGITPVMSLLKTTLVEEPHSRFILFFGNRGFDHIIFREELETLKNKFTDRLSVHHILSREHLPGKLFQGRLDAEKCRSFARVFFSPAEVEAFFICGPEEMLLDLRDALADLGVDRSRIHYELFHVSDQTRRTAARVQETAPRLDSVVTVIQDGVQFDFNLTSDGSSLLDAAMRAGADLPFSCKGGVCSTCKAKVLEGQVEMEVNYGLEPDEVEAGYILTCQSHPKTDRLVVSFDA